jgi:arginase family enzyme
MLFKLKKRQNPTTKISACVIGVPSSSGQRRSGVEHGPEILRKHGLVKKLRKFNNVVDAGNVRVVEDIKDDFEGNVKNPRTVGANNEKIMNAVSESLAKYRPVITLGGDHSMAIGKRHFQKLIFFVLFLDFNFQEQSALRPLS